MNSESRVRVHWAVLVATAVVLIAAGGGATYFWLGPGSASPEGAHDHGATAEQLSPSPGIPADTAPAPRESAPLPDVVVSLNQTTADRSGITIEQVTEGFASDELRAPGIVEANAYRQVAVTPIVSGRITRVSVDLGQHVQQGQTLAVIFSPELAELQTRFVSARAELEAHEQELLRTEKLVEIGAASRQELERIHAGHTARRAEVESAASRLRLLGLSAGAIERLGPGQTQDPTTEVPAPITGVVTERLANVGLNVDQSAKLFTVVDLSSVWVVANLYEKDFARVRVGTAATVTTHAYPDLRLQGRVSYIDPQVSQETRTARVRVEVPNVRAELRLGMYAEALFGGRSGTLTPMIPRTAVQNVGDRTVVYLVNSQKAGTFIEREVRLGAAAGDYVSVLTGVQRGDAVVGKGSFYVRAERERLGLRAGLATGAYRPTDATSHRRAPS